MKSERRFVPFIPLLVAAVAFPALAFENPLSSTSIRDAYFLGKDGGDRANAFLAGYVAHPPQPNPGRFFIAMIQVKTPFVLVKERSALIYNYSAPQAEEDFLDKPAGFAVRIQVDKTPGYRRNSGKTSAEGFETVPGPGWRDFKYRLIQNDEEIAANSAHAESICIGPDGCTITGWDVTLNYDADAIKSSLIDVEVAMPDGQSVNASFDLDELR
jgi:hypothetical protein